MAEKYSFVCPTGGIRIDRFLTENIEDITRSAVQKIIEESNVTVNGKVARALQKTISVKSETVLKLLFPMQSRLKRLHKI